MKRWQASLNNKEQQHFGLRKLSVGVASVLLGTTVYFGLGGTVVHADSQVDAVSSDIGSEEINSNVKAPYAAPIEPAQAQKVVNYGSNVVNSDTVDSNVENTNAVNNVADNKVEANNNIVADFATQEMTINRNQVQPASVAQVEASTVQSSNNGGFDSNTWGTLDVSKWQGQVVSNTDIDGVTRQYYELTGYTGDMNHIIVPNEADLEATGVNTGGYQVGINADTTHSWFKNGDPKTIAFSKTDNKMVKALGSNWTSAFTGACARDGFYANDNHSLGKFNGANLTVSNVTDMSDMFYGNQISDLTSLASWKTDNVTDMNSMFYENKISNLTPLANWKTDKVTNMNNMFYGNQISNLTPLTNWKTNNVTNMSWMFSNNQISDLTPLANWKTDNVTDMNGMFDHDKISNLTSLANWKTDNVTNMMYMFDSNQISDLTPLANWKTDNVTNMSNMFGFNPIKLADFRKWDFSQSKYLGSFISNYMSNVNSIVVVSSKDLSLLNGKSKIGIWDSTLSSVVDTRSNSISINSDSIDMPTLYATDDMTTPVEELAEKLVKQTRAQKIADYQKAHPTAKISLITPDPTNHSYDAPAIMANQKYRAVVSNKVTYQFVDDDNDGSNVGNMIIVSGEDGSIQKTNLVLPKYYDLAAGQILPYVVVIPTSDTTVTIHLVHTQYNVVIKYLDLSGSQVGFQTITGKWGSIQKVGTLQVPQDYVLQSVGVPTQVAISREDAELDLVVVPALTFRSYVNVKDADLHHSVTRTINITRPDKSIQTVVQTVVFGRNAWTNKKTGEITYSNWVPEAAPDFVAYVAPQLDGYVPGVVESIAADPAKDNVVADVAYTALPQAVSHPYIDVNGQTYDSIPTGYKVVVGQNAKDGAQLIVKDVKLTVPKIEYVTRTITIAMPNHRTRTIRQRVVKGHSFLTAYLPKLRGYNIKISEDVDHAGIGAYTADHDVNVTVVFTK